MVSMGDMHLKCREAVVYGVMPPITFSQGS